MSRLPFLVLVSILLVPAVALGSTADAPGEDSALRLLPVPTAAAVERVAAPPDLAVVQRNVEKRLAMLKVHRALGVASVVTMFTAQSFGLVNRVALAEGVPRKDLEPTLMLHRVFVGSSLVTYFGAGGVALAMPGPGGDRASKALTGGPRVMRNVHVGLSIAHAIALAVAGTTGVLQAYVARDTKHWEPLVTTHQVAASTAAGLMLTAIFVIQN